MTIKKDLLTFNFTKDGIKEVRGIVLHSMWGTYQGSIAWFKNPDSKASAHYLISKDGEITQMVEEKDMAWHAGIIDDVAPEFVRPNPNWYTIGIELEDMRDANWQYPEAQRKATSNLVKSILARHNLRNDQVLLHKQLNPSRRSDPVGNFAMEWVIGSIEKPFTSTVKQLVTDILLGTKKVTSDNEINAWVERFTNPKEMIEEIVNNDKVFRDTIAEPYLTECHKESLRLVEQIEKTKNAERLEFEKNWQMRLDSANLKIGELEIDLNTQKEINKEVFIDGLSWKDLLIMAIRKFPS